MAKSTVLHETQKVLELMCESEEKIELLQNELTENKALYLNIKNDLKELRKLLNKNIAELEDNQHVKSNIKNYNQQFNSFAQDIYTCIEELYSNLYSHDAEYVKNKEWICRNNEQIEKISNVFKHKVKTLTDQLEILENKNRESELEAEELAMENEKLRKKLKTLDQDIDCCTNYIECEEKILDENRNIEETIENLRKCIESTASEINENSNAIVEVKQLEEKLENEGNVKIFEIEQQIHCCRMEIEEITSSIESHQLKHDEITTKIMSLKEHNKCLEEEFCSYERELFDIETKLNNLEGDKTVDDCKKSISKHEDAYKEQEDTKRQIKSEICTFETKIEHLREFIAGINEFLTSHKPADTDLGAEIELKENELKELKMLHHKLKEDTIKQTADLEAALKKSREELELTELTNKKLEEDIESVMSELDKKKSELEQMTLENDWQQGHLRELDRKAHTLKVQVTQAKAERLKHMKKPAGQSVVVSNLASSSSSKAKRKTIRNWDSDSSAEGLDTRLSDMVKERMKKASVGVRKQ